jgi:hypothetical protein
LHLACGLDFAIHTASLLIENPRDDELLFDHGMDAPVDNLQGDYRPHDAKD